MDEDLEYLNIWLTEKQIKSIQNGEQIHFEASIECDDCGDLKQFVIQINSN